MLLQIDKLGKVAITIEQGYWNNGKDYDKLTVVEKEGTFGTFISRKPVPAGTPLTNRTYWIPFSSLKEEIVLAYEEWVNRYGGIISNEAIVINQLQKIINDIYSHLPQGIFVEGDIDCIEHGTTDVLNLHVGTTNEKEAKFFVYVNDVLFGSYNIIEETIDIPVNGDTAVRVECIQNEFSYIGNWNVVDVYPTYIGCSNEYTNILNNDSYKIPVTTNIDGEYTLNVETEGDFIFICVPKSTIVDKVTMNGFDVPMDDELIVTDEHNIEYKILKSSNGYTVGEYKIFIGEYKGDDKDTIESILERLDTLYSKFDNITKADEEDITEVSENDTKVFKLADKDYDTTKFSGMGRVNLRKNIVDGHNYLTQEMISKPNTIYKIQYDYEIAPSTTEYIAELNQGVVEAEGHNFNYKVIAVNTGDIITKESGIGSTTAILYMTSDNVWHNPHTSTLTVEDGWTIAIADVVGGSTAVNYNVTTNTITIPENCVLEFEGGSLSGGELVGQNTEIQSDKTCFDSIVLNGTFSNDVGHLFWFKEKEDVSIALSNLINKFHTIVLEYGGYIKSTLPVITSDTIVDGLGNTFIPQGVNSVFANKTTRVGSFNVTIQNIIFDYKNNGWENNRVYCINIATEGIVSIHNIICENYKNPSNTLCNFCAIQIHTLKSTNILVDSCMFKNLIVTGDGIPTEGKGSNRGIIISGDLLGTNENPGPCTISNCTFDMIQTKNQSGEYTIDDGDGIYIAMIDREAYNTRIENCTFHNVGKRCIKIQGSGINVNRITVSTDDEFVDYCDVCIDGQYNDNIVIDGVYGNYGAELFRLSRGNNGIIKNINFNGPVLLKFGEDTNYDFSLINCIFDGITAVYIGNNSVQGRCNGTPQKGIIIKNSILNCSNYLKANYSGIYSVDKPILYIFNSKITCGKEISDNHIALLSFENCQVSFNKTKIGGAVTDLDFYAKNSLFILESNSVSASDTSYVFSCKDTTIINCTFSSLENVQQSTNVFGINAGTKNVLIDNCTISIPAVNSFNILSLNTSQSVVFRNCIFSAGLLFAKKGKSIILENVEAQSIRTKTGDADSGFSIFAYQTKRNLFNADAKQYIVEDNSGISIVGITAQRPTSNNIYIGFRYFDTTLGKQIYWNGSVWVDAIGIAVDVQIAGLITKRPALADIYAGFMYLVTQPWEDATLGTDGPAGPYYFDGSNSWILADGTTKQDGQMPTRS